MLRPHNQSIPIKAPLFYDRISTSGKQIVMRYPPDTKAFLYYFTPPEKPRIAGELRLRVTSSDDPASFQSGSDLLIPNGQPWSRPLYIVSKFCTPLYENLRQDQLIPDDLDVALSTLPPISPRYRQRRLLYTLNDTFILNFSIRQRQFFVITEQGMEKLQFNAFSETPYTGIGLARFERSTLPVHKGTRTVVLRFLKIITPVKCVIPSYDGYIEQPEEGQLYRRHHRYRLGPKAWNVNIDKKGAMSRGLRLLWDS